MMPALISVFFNLEGNVFLGKLGLAVYLSSGLNHAM